METDDDDSVRSSTEASIRLVFRPYGGNVFNPYLHFWMEYRVVTESTPFMGVLGTRVAKARLKKLKWNGDKLVRFIEVPGSEGTMEFENSAINLCMAALHKGELVGESADSALYTMYYATFLEHYSTAGYFQKFASELAAKDIVRSQLATRFADRPGEHVFDVLTVKKVVEDVAPSPLAALATMIYIQKQDPDLGEAISALCNAKTATDNADDALSEVAPRAENLLRGRYKEFKAFALKAEPVPFTLRGF